MKQRKRKKWPGAATVLLWAAILAAGFGMGWLLACR